MWLMVEVVVDGAAEVFLLLWDILFYCSSYIILL